MRTMDVVVPAAYALVLLLAVLYLLATGFDRMVWPRRTVTRWRTVSRHYRVKEEISSPVWGVILGGLLRLLLAGICIGLLSVLF